jgi:tRNA pseudouridine38-40 synthase
VSSAQAKGHRRSDSPRNIKLLIEYLGSRFIGWQRQRGPLLSVEGKILQAITSISGENLHVNVAGRTDTGVHAIGQIANFITYSPMDGRRWAPALNHYLPVDISIHLSQDVPLQFNAKRDSLSKRYRYRFYNASQAAALEYNAWHIRSPIDIDRIKRARQCLLGEHDFNAFRSAHCDASHAFRDMLSIDVERVPRPPLGHYVDITFHANAYCRHMCRILAGTLLEIGLGRRSEESLKECLKSRQREQAGQTAEAKGLTLMEVLYPT